MKISWFIGVLVVIAITIISCVKMSKSKKSHPNIIFIKVEDDEVGRCEIEVSLPAINKLAKQSLIFNYAYAHPNNILSEKILFTGNTNSVKLNAKGQKMFGLWEKQDLGGDFLNDFIRSNYEVLFLGDWHYNMHHSNTNRQLIEDKTRSSMEKALNCISKNEDPIFINIKYDTFNSNNKDSILSHNSFLKMVNEEIEYLINGLEENQERSNTVIIFTTNNGYYRKCNNIPLRGEKGTIYEGGMRVYTMINWPGKLNARRVNYAVSEADFLPTIDALAGIEEENKNFTGYSLTQLFNNNPIAFYKRKIVYELANPVTKKAEVMIRSNKYKLIECEGVFQLYNLEEDCSEENNLVDKRPEIAKQLSKR